MFYQYKCKDCERITELRLSPNGIIPTSTDCYCGNFAWRVFGGHQINMRNWQSKIHEYNKLPEHAKEMNGVLKKHI